MFAGWSEICPTLRLPDEVANQLNWPNESLGYRARRSQEVFRGKFSHTDVFQAQSNHLMVGARR